MDQTKIEMGGEEMEKLPPLTTPEESPEKPKDVGVGISKESEEKIGSMVDYALKEKQEDELTGMVASTENLPENKEENAEFIREDGREKVFMSKVQEITGLSEEQVKNIMYENERLFNRLFSESDGPSATKKFEDIAFTQEERAELGLESGATMHDVMVRAMTKFVDASPEIAKYQAGLEEHKQLTGVMGEAKGQLKQIISSYHGDFLWGDGYLGGEFVENSQAYGNWWPETEKALDNMDWTVLGAYSISTIE